MACEIEFKAHIKDEEVSILKDNLSKIFHYNGYVSKIDEYYSSSESGLPLFRIRVQVYENTKKDDKTELVKEKKLIITSKPNKSKSGGMEINAENEFYVDFDQLENIKEFVLGLNLVVCRRKYKEGYDFSGSYKKNNLHVELLNVKYLGWFLEVEITDYDVNNSPKNKDLDNKVSGNKFTEKEEEKIKEVFRSLLKDLKISLDRVESTGYYKMLSACGHGLN